ncbi:MAG: hypothetical protein LBL66_08925, partial [Clostridiales bacterium]|nr:hypothetical protein [Clostridiales bacterium]
MLETTEKRGAFLRSLEIAASRFRAPRNRLVAKYNADAMRVFSCVKRVKILLVALLQTAIFTRITRKNPSPIISR